MLAVSDTGCGMTPAVKARLFEPFFTTKEKGRGTGLGLATTFGAVKQARGAVEVYSEVDEGTTFKIYLPAVEGDVVPVDRPRRTATLPVGNETVLLVEDDEGVRRLAIRILERLGYTVVAATDGFDALARLSRHDGEVHLLMTDVVMPGMNGRELSARVAETHPHVKVLFASGYTENIIVHHGVVEENLSFIAKPYTMQALAHKVRQVLD